MKFYSKYLKKIIFAFVFCIVFQSALNAQNQDTGFWNHVRFGGGIGLSFGNDFFSGTIAPSAIYDFNDVFAIGLGLNATFSKQDNFHKSTILGGSLISLFNPIPDIQLSAELEQLNVDRNGVSTATSRKMSSGLH